MMYVTWISLLQFMRCSYWLHIIWSGCTHQKHFHLRKAYSYVAKTHPTERVTFYRLTDSSRDSFYSDILPKLERSLSLALIHFLPLSGHLKWNPQDPKPHIVVLQQDTVSLTVAESSADFSCIPTKGCVPKLSYALWCPSYQFPLTPHLSCLSRSLSSRTKASPSEPPSTMLPSWTDKRRQSFTNHGLISFFFF